MASFRQGDSFRDVVEKLRHPERLDSNELIDSINAAVSHPEATARRLGFLLESPNPQIREAGLAFVVRSAGNEAVDVIVAAMDGVQGAERAELARALLSLDRESTMRALSHVFKDPRNDRRSLVLDIASVDPVWQDWLGHLRQALGSGESGLRVQAARILRRHASNSTVATILRELILDDDPTVRSEAIQGLRESSSADLAETLAASLSNAPDGAQQRLMTALSQLTNEPGVHLEDFLFPALSDEDPDTRARAVRMLAKLPDAEPVLRRFLAHSRGLAPWLRDRATKSLLEMAQRLADPLLALMSDPDEETRVQAMFLALRIDDPRVIEPAAEVFRNASSWWVRTIAAEILGRYPNAKVLKFLLPFLDDPEMRHCVTSALSKFDLPESTDHLVKCLGDRRRSIRSTALNGLIDRVHGNVIQAVATIARHDEEEAIRAKALEVLRGFGAAAGTLVRTIEGENTAAQRGRLDSLASDLCMVNEELNRPR